MGINNSTEFYDTVRTQKGTVDFRNKEKTSNLKGKPHFPIDRMGRLLEEPQAPKAVPQPTKRQKSRQWLSPY
jgi:hypothetical protein